MTPVFVPSTVRCTSRVEIYSDLSQPQKVCEFSKGNPYPKMAKTFRVKDLHPRNLTWNLKSEVPRKVSSSWKPSF